MAHDVRMRVYVELPNEWGPIQLISTRWRDAGYTVAIHRYVGSGEVAMEILGLGSVLGGPYPHRCRNATSRARLRFSDRGERGYRLPHASDEARRSGYRLLDRPHRCGQLSHWARRGLPLGHRVTTSATAMNSAAVAIPAAAPR